MWAGACAFAVDNNIIEIRINPWEQNKKYYPT